MPESAKVMRDNAQKANLKKYWREIAQIDTAIREAADEGKNSVRVTISGLWLVNLYRSYEYEVVRGNGHDYEIKWY
jgi:hypothetical protein